MALPAQMGPRPVQQLLDDLTAAMEWPRSRPARVLVGSRAARVDGAALCVGEDAINDIAAPHRLALLALPPSSAFARSGRRSYDVFLQDAPVDEWERIERVIADASEMLAGGVGGIDELLVDALGLTPTGPVVPVDRDVLKLVGFVPADALDEVREAVFGAGAGHIGDYDCCSFATPGTGTFRGGDGSSPTVGQRGVFEQVDEVRFETVVPSHLRNAVVRAFITAHPYEEPAFDIVSLRTPARVGTGRVAVGDATVAQLHDRLRAVDASATSERPEAASPSAGDVVVTSGSVGAILPELLVIDDLRAVVATSVTDAEQALLLERGASVLVADRSALVSSLGTSLCARLSRDVGVAIEITSALRFPGIDVATAPTFDSEQAMDTSGTWQLNFDGGSRGNPGPAAFGFVLRDGGGEIVARIGEVLGRTTNNVAEYTGLVRGLERALEVGVSDLKVFGDSELIVKQLRGEYRVKNEQLKPLYEQAKSLIDQFDSVSVAHVYRTDNADADALVNEALDNA